MTDGPPPPCAGKTNLFFSFDPEDVARAKAMCVTCDRRDPCLEAAMADPRCDQKGHGIWGGATPEERRQIRTRRMRAAG